MDKIKTTFCGIDVTVKETEQSIRFASTENGRTIVFPKINMERLNEFLAVDVKSQKNQR